MASSSYFLTVIGLCVCVTLLNPISCYGNYLFVFGDSLYDVGNNQYFSPDENIPSYSYPYGMLIGHATGRFSDGLVVPDFIALFLNISLVPPCLKPGANFTNGASFASAGGGVLNDSTYAANLPLQFTYFKDMLGNWTTKALAEGIYLFSIGGDDYFKFITEHMNDIVSETEQEQFVQQVLGSFSIVLKEIYDLGGRKFVFQNVAPMGCLPMMRNTYGMTNDTCPQFPLTMANLHNTGLSKTLANLAVSLPGFTYSIFDYNEALMRRINHPLNYGFQVGDTACCGTGTFNANDCGTKPYNLCQFPSNYVFFDGGHHTQHSNEQLAWSIWTDKDLTAPYTMQELLAHKIKDEKAHKLSDQIADE